MTRVGRGRATVAAGSDAAAGIYRSDGSDARGDRREGVDREGQVNERVRGRTDEEVAPEDVRVGDKTGDLGGPGGQDFEERGRSGLGDDTASKVGDRDAGTASDIYCPGGDGMKSGMDERVHDKMDGNEVQDLLTAVQDERETGQCALDEEGDHAVAITGTIHIG